MPTPASTDCPQIVRPDLIAHSLPTISVYWPPVGTLCHLDTGRVTLGNTRICGRIAARRGMGDTGLEPVTSCL